LIGQPIDPTDPDFTFEKILQIGLLKHSDACVEIGEKASKEYNIESMLNEMYGIWDKI
jgi:dynein heavy chain